jgi:ABC-type Zn uptake system ZnuABC Zn-binding protein ZnuA
MALTKEQEQFYKKTLEETKKQLEEIDAQMEKELQKIREKLAELQVTKKSLRQIYEATAKLLGVESELEEEEEESSEISKK